MTVLSSQSPGISPSYPETLNSAPGLSSVPGLPHMLGGEWNSAQTETQSGPGNLSRFKQYGERSGMERGAAKPTPSAGLRGGKARRVTTELCSAESPGGQSKKGNVTKEK